MFDLFESFFDDFSTSSDDFGFCDLASTESDRVDYFTGINEITPVEVFPFLEELIGNGETSLFDSIDIADFSDSPETFFGYSDILDFGNIFDDLWSFIEPIFIPGMSGGELNLIDATQFAHDGRFDPINQCIVEGDVANDILFIQEQTGQTCSLMAQEQFIERMTGNRIPEEELERIASEMGVYDPIFGTSCEGWNAILDYFDIPNTQYFNATPDMLDVATRNGDDILIGVDARIFYNDPIMPPGSGHAVTIVGRGVDPSSGDLNGYYITDSNCPGQAHFKTVAELERAWYNDMITVQTTLTA